MIAIIFFPVVIFYLLFIYKKPFLVHKNPYSLQRYNKKCEYASKAINFCKKDRFFHRIRCLALTQACLRVRGKMSDGKVQPIFAEISRALAYALRCATVLSK
jgi:hypothetical protein